MDRHGKTGESSSSPVHISVPHGRWCPHRTLFLVFGNASPRAGLSNISENGRFHSININVLLNEPIAIYCNIPGVSVRTSEHGYSGTSLENCACPFGLRFDVCSVCFQQPADTKGCLLEDRGAHYSLTGWD